MSTPLRAGDDEEEGYDPVLEGLWARVLDAWGDEKPHAALLEHAVRAGRLPDIAGRYRRLSAEPDKAAVAEKQLDAIVASATQALFAMKMPRPESTPLAITLTAFGICLVLLAWVVLAWWGKQ